MSRFTSRAPSFGLHPGFAIRPKLLVGPPNCKTWSQLQNLSKDTQLFEVKRTYLPRHMDAVAKMYHGQVKDHNCFHHEHSQGTETLKASSTQECVFVFLLRFQRRDGVHWIRNDLCATRLTVKEYSARKVTGWLSNSRCVENELENFLCENWTQPKNPCQDELVLAISSGRRDGGGFHRTAFHWP